MVIESDRPRDSAASLRVRIRKPLSIELRTAEIGDMVSVGLARSGEHMVEERFVCECDPVRRKPWGFVWIRRLCELVIGLVAPLAEGFERLEVLR